MSLILNHPVDVSRNLRVLSVLYKKNRAKATYADPTARTPSILTALYTSIMTPRKQPLNPPETSSRPYQMFPLKTQRLYGLEAVPPE